MGVNRKIGLAGAALALGVLLPACADKSLDSRARDLVPHHGFHYVKGTAFLLTTQEWEASPWYRPSEDAFDLDAPVYVVIGEGNWGCRVSAATWATVVPGQKLECRWRPARRRR